MRTFKRCAAALTLAGAVALAATPSQARHGWNAAAGGFVAGAVIGAAAANANNGYYYGYGPDYDAYAYAPGYAYGPAPGYIYAPRRHYYYGSGYSSEENCTISPASGDYTPCYSH